MWSVCMWSVCMWSVCMWSEDVPVECVCRVSVSTQHIHTPLYCASSTKSCSCPSSSTAVSSAIDAGES